jgi:hypothetical protein
MYSFEPVNKLLLVEKIEPKKQAERAFYVPEVTLAPTHVVVKLLMAGKASPFAQYEGMHLIVQNMLIEKVSFEGDTFFVISESGVQGILRKNEL